MPIPTMIATTAKNCHERPIWPIPLRFYLSFYRSAGTDAAGAGAIGGDEPNSSRARYSTIDNATTVNTMNCCLRPIRLAPTRPNVTFL